MIVSSPSSKKIYAFKKDKPNCSKKSRKNSVSADWNFQCNGHGRSGLSMTRPGPQPRMKVFK